MPTYLSKEGKRFINCKINKTFINKIKNNYGNKITISEYLIERLKFKKINNAFVTGWKHTSPLITPIQKCALEINNFDLIYNKYELNSIYSAKTYTEYSNNIGVIVNSTDSDFEDLKDLLCISKPLLSLCIFKDYTDLKEAINNTTSIHPCFIDTHTLHYPHNFPSILEYMMTLCETEPKAPVHINISNKICSEHFEIDNLFDNESNESMSNISYLNPPLL